MGKYFKIEFSRFIPITMLFSVTGSFVWSEPIIYYEYLYDTQWELGKITESIKSQDTIFTFHPCNQNLKKVELETLIEDDISNKNNCPSDTENKRTGGAPPLVLTSVLNEVLDRGHLKCGVSQGAVGFATIGDNGKWKGFDVSLCRAVAAAVLGDGSKVKFIPIAGKTRFTALASGEIDLLARNTTWTYSRDVDLKFEFIGVNYYDGQGFMVPKALGVASAKDLDGATVCIQTGTTTELNLAGYFRSNNISYEPVPIETNAEGRAQYLAGACDVYTTDASGLAATRATFETPDDHVVLPEIISKEPLGPLVRHGDNQWGDIVRWTLNALITAEELGVTSANIDKLSAKAGKNPEVNRLLGTEGDLGAMLGLDKQWALRAIAQSGNYGEIFDSNIGEGSPVGIARGLNASWVDGGLIYSPPFR